MTDIGHNNPPALEAMSLHIEDLFATISGSTASAITTDEQEAGLDQLLKDARKTRQDADKMRASEKKPHMDAANKVQADWKPLLDRVKAGEQALKDALTPYRVAKQAAKDEAARKAREEAGAKELAAQKALKESDILDERFEAEAELENAAKLKISANRIDRSATGLRTIQTAVVTDYSAALRWINQNDRDAMNAFADEYARKRGTPFDGVEMKTERKAV